MKLPRMRKFVLVHKETGVICSAAKRTIKVTSRRPTKYVPKCDFNNATLWRRAERVVGA